MFGWMLKKVLGSKHEREIKKIQPLVDAIAQQEAKLEKLSDADLKARTAQFQEKLANGASLDDLLVPAYATVREAGKRVFGMRHYDVQMVGGIVLHQGKIAEMRTGEGKTLVATLPCYLNALEGKGVHVVTVNDYLARRDAEWMGQLHAYLGLSTGVVLPQMSNVAKKRAYAADITYGQNNEFGFDYMRDNMKFSIYDYVQRDLNFAIVDEVDSILIDEARTPLIISGPGSTASEKYEKISDLVPKLRRDEHFELDEKARNVALTEEGMEHAQQLLQQAGLLRKREGASYRESAEGNLYDPANLETLHILQQSLRAHTLYHRDQHYMVGGGGKIMIIDEFTGRTLPGRRWSDGLHQAVEAKERVPIQDENITLATISFQNLFRLYRKLSGMTGTADTEATEFHKIYELDVVVIPTNKPIARLDDEDLVYKSEREKFIAVAEDIERVNAEGRPILVGTTSVEKSDALSRLLAKRGIHHEVLNAKQHEREAYIVAQAGTEGAVTVATNMAGRGTDIVLGGNAEMIARMDVMRNADDALREDKEAFEAAVHEAEHKYEQKCKADGKRIKDLGGLHIIGTERHESRRVDNQLRGRAGRQGDPGSSRFFLSLEDDLMRIFAGDRVQRMMDTLGMEEGEPIEHRWVTKAVENAQKKVEERNFDIRKHLLDYDDVMNQQRKSVYELRKQVLQGKYRTVLTDEERKKGLEPQPLVEEIDYDLVERAKPILEQMVKIHAAAPPPQGATPEELDQFRDAALAADLKSLGPVRTFPLERDVYSWFGTVVDVPADATGAEVYDLLIEAVGMAMTEQRERMLDLVDELIGSSIERHCPPGKHHEDWNIEAVEDEFEIQFEMEAPDLSRFSTAEEIAQRLYQDAENVLLKKMEDLGPANYLRLFRNFYLQEIDQQWIENLQAMDQLRDGIGLRGYGQRDPKREYKREGFRMFQDMMRSVKANVATRLFTVERAREEDLQKLEAQRRQAAEERQRQAQPQHQGDQNSAAPGVQAGGQPARRPQQAAPRGARPAGAPAGAAPAQRPAPQRQAEPEPMNRKQRRALAKKKRKNKDARP
ncbi:MAG: preprotein translocase subunit SecA [Sandaracinus sp.]|nr:preprotein translocase subunit SecA [Sandaracinus sp.]